MSDRTPIPLSFFPNFLDDDQMQTVFGDDPRGLGAFMVSPDAQKIIGHFQKQLESRQPSKDEMEMEWGWLFASLDAARSALAKGDLHRACVAFFDIGVLVSTYTAPLSDEMKRVLKLAEGAEKAFQTSLGPINRKRETAKKIVALIAKNKWAADTENMIRIGEMAQLVWNELHSEFANEAWAGYLDEVKTVLPDNANALRLWLKDIAPDYAKKPGRPRKK